MTNLNYNQVTELSKGDVFVLRVKTKHYKMTEDSKGRTYKMINGSYDVEEETYEVVKTYKSKNGLRAKIKNIELDYCGTILINDFIEFHKNKKNEIYKLEIT